MAQQPETPRKKIGITLPVDQIDEVRERARKNGRLISYEFERLIDIGLDVEDGREPK